MEWITDYQVWVSLITLTFLEIVLGIDNVIFISILAGKLPAQDQDRARKLGLSLALITRVLLLFSLAWMMKLTAPLFSVMGNEISGRDLILIVGGLFLLAKSTHEIHDKLEGEDGAITTRIAPTFASVIVQILLIDIVFSLDSVITAVGMVGPGGGGEDGHAAMGSNWSMTLRMGIMITAVVVAVGVMLFFAKWISDVVHRHPTLKMLALSFLLLIGVTLIADGFGQHINKGYVYFAMAFSVGVECLNIRLRSKQKSPAVELKQPYR
jgi:predicted tellurium resistance membrane protein TerC